MHEARERFLRAIAERIPAERIAELHLFPPLRQGGRETGIAVVAVYPDEVFVQAELPLPPGADGVDTGEPAERGESGESGAAEARMEPPLDAEKAAAGAGAEPEVSAGPPPRHHDVTPEVTEPHPLDALGIESAPSEPPGGEDAPGGAGSADRIDAGASRRPPARLTVFRAVYRWTLKGADRGKWEVEVIAEADAPLLAIEDVVRGVHRRAGGEAEPERLTGDAVRAALSEQRWTSTT